MAKITKEMEYNELAKFGECLPAVPKKNGALAPPGYPQNNHIIESLKY
jgi:hypothetical protein